MSLLDKLTLEERELLQDTLPTELHKVYVKIIEAIVEDCSRRVLYYNLIDLADDSIGELALLKAKAQGAAAVLTQFQALRKTAKK